MGQHHRPPGLLCIGTQRSGTTWLWSNLSGHPDFWVPYYKELHYFDAEGGMPSKPVLARRVNVLNTLLATHRRTGTVDPLLLAWATRFARARCNDDAWYQSLFSEAPPERCPVDFTPCYCTLSAGAVARAATLCVNTKVVYLLRDPVDRAWSQVHLDRKLGVQNTVRTPEEFQRWCLQPKVRKYSAYAQSLSRWRESFGEHNVFVGYYDELATNPLGLLERLCRWMGVRYDPSWFANTATQFYNRRTPVRLPDAFFKAAAPLMLAELDALVKLLPDAPAPARWLQHCQDRLVG